MSRAVKAQGIECPIIREGDNIVDIVVDSVLKFVQKTSKEWHDYEGKPLDFPITTYNINDKDIIGITESVVARAAGQYITVDDIAADIEKKFGKDTTICLYQPIYSRNRFSMILKGIARAARRIIIVMPEHDEVGNPSGVNPFTGVDIQKYYKELCETENCICETIPSIYAMDINIMSAINCRLRPSTDDDCYYFRLFDKVYTLKDICSDVSPDWGVLGTNKATEERLKLFPSKAECQRVCEEVKAKIREKTGRNVIVCSYGDGCFKDPVGGIWEFADPITMPGYTDAALMESTPCEVKIKYLADSGLSDSEINDKINFAEEDTMIDKNSKMNRMGTTPRLYRDLLASLMDLTSGSGDRATPVVLIQNYF